MGNSKNIMINGIPLIMRTIQIPVSSTQDKVRARDLRKKGILSEVIFWRLVKTGKFHGIDFDRQRCIGPYIVDFYIRFLGVAIELDGASHIGRYDYDVKREKYLQMLGVYIIHIEANLVMSSPDIVMKYLESRLIDEFGKK